MISIQILEFHRRPYSCKRSLLRTPEKRSLALQGGCYPWHDSLFVVCLEFFFPLENSSLIWRRHHCRWRAAHSSPRTCDTHTQTKCWAVCSGAVTTYFELGLSRLGYEHQTVRLRGKRSSPLCHCRGLLDIRNHLNSEKAQYICSVMIVFFYICKFRITFSF